MTLDEPPLVAAQARVVRNAHHMALLMDRRRTTPPSFERVALGHEIRLARRRLDQAEALYRQAVRAHTDCLVPPDRKPANDPPSPRPLAQAVRQVRAHGAQLLAHMPTIPHAAPYVPPPHHLTGLKRRCPACGGLTVGPTCGHCGDTPAAAP